jgi:hypothetical protein
MLDKPRKILRKRITIKLVLVFLDAHNLILQIVMAGSGIEIHIYLNQLNLQYCNAICTGRAKRLLRTNCSNELPITYKFIPREKLRILIGLSEMLFIISTPLFSANKKLILGYTRRILNIKYGLIYAQANLYSEAANLGISFQILDRLSRIVFVSFAVFINLIRLGTHLQDEPV